MHKQVTGMSYTIYQYINAKILLTKLQISNN
jgi:hypothetical protein